jgi:hypothetical protein
MVTLTWPGGEHEFALRIEHLRALQDRCDAGPAWVLARLGSSQWLVEDVTETLRLGLEGAGLEKKEARRLVQMHVEGALALSVLTARAILMSALYGDPDDEVGKDPNAVGETVNPISPEESSGGASSSETPQSSDGPPAT